jgi:glycosyltransferase involved in cell wall biosynthesis
MVVQPVVPHYRVPFFRQLLGDTNLDVEIHASMAIPLSEDPVSVGWTDRRLVTDHRCLAFFGGRVFWQCGLHLGAHYERGDVVVLSGNPRFLSNLPLLVAAKKRGVAVVWWGQGWSATSSPMRTAVRRWLMRLTDIVLVYSEPEAAELVALGFDPVRVFSANNAIDQEPLCRAKATVSRAVLATFQEANDLLGRRVLLFCGRLTVKCQLEVALAALRLVQQADPTVALVVIGDGPHRDRLQELASSLGLGDGVRFVGAVFEEAELAPWFMSAEVFVYPGAVGLSLLHAFGYGLPVITHGNRKHQMPEFHALSPGANGLVFAEGDVKSLAGAIMQLLASRGLRATLSAGARATVATGYSLAEMTSRFVCAVRRASARAARPLAGQVTQY